MDEEPSGGWEPGKVVVANADPWPSEHSASAVDAFKLPPLQRLP